MTKKESDQLPKNLPEWIADLRQKAVKLPFDMAMQMYLGTELRIPRILWGEGNVAYHYTDSAGLLGLVSNHRFWATNTAFLNDPSEGLHALDIAKEALLQRANSTNSEGIGALFAKEASRKIARSVDTELYVTSFSRHADLLSQWRAYGASGAGYALGFDMQHLPPHPQFGWLVEVQYDDDLLRTVVNKAADVYIEHLQQNNERHLEDTVEWAVKFFNFIGQGFKHPSFREEAEVRLIFSRSTSGDGMAKDSGWYKVPISHRTKGSAIISYLETPLDFPDAPFFRSRLPLTKIIVGPVAAWPQSERALKSLLLSKGYDGVEISQSRVPFRT